MLWFGLVLIVVGALLYYFSGRAAAKAHHIQATETSRVGDLRALIEDVRASMPGGVGSGYRQFAQLKGRVVSDAPLRGELSDVEAVVVETTVKRVVERREERRDAQGNVRTHWRKTEETVSENRREAEFDLEDDTGRVRVKPTRKAVDLERVVDRFEPANAIEQLHGDNLVLSMGGFRLSVSGGHAGGSHSRTLGYKFTERVLPVGRRLYALGEVADVDDEGIIFRAPTDDDEGKPFILSLKTEAELVKGQQKTATILKVVAVCLGLGGVALAVVGAVG